VKGQGVHCLTRKNQAYHEQDTVSGNGKVGQVDEALELGRLPYHIPGSQKAGGISQFLAFAAKSVCLATIILFRDLRCSGDVSIPSG
jgi:hypothetical protein